MRWLDSITNSGHEFEPAPGTGDGQGSLAGTLQSMGRKESDMTD